MSNYDNWRELATDLQLDNDELREKLRVLGENFNALKKELNAIPGPHAPGSDGDMSTCGNCNSVLDAEWTYCPFCRCEIDWDGDDGGNWYAEEGERALYDGVYAPLMEAMRS